MIKLIRDRSSCISFVLYTWLIFFVTIAAVWLTLAVTKSDNTGKGRFITNPSVFTYRDHPHIGDFTPEGMSADASNSAIEKEDMSVSSSRDHLLQDEIIFAVLKLPLEYSQIERHRNIARLKKDIPNLVVVDGFHGNDIPAINRLIRAGKKFNLTLDPGYFDGSGKPVHMGKLGLYATFLTIFNDLVKLYYDLPDENETNLFDNFDGRRVQCLVVIEDDFRYMVNDREVIKKTCDKLLNDDNEDIIFTRLGPYNAMNVYDVSKLERIIDTVGSIGVTNPFDLFTQSRHWYAVSNKLTNFRSRTLHVRSTLISQAKVSIDSWNKCLASSIEQTLLNPNELMCSLEITR